MSRKSRNVEIMNIKKLNLLARDEGIPNTKQMDEKVRALIEAPNLQKKTEEAIMKHDFREFELIKNDEKLSTVGEVVTPTSPMRASDGNLQRTAGGD